MFFFPILLINIDGHKTHRLVLATPLFYTEQVNGSLVGPCGYLNSQDTTMQDTGTKKFGIGDLPVLLHAPEFASILRFITFEFWDTQVKRGFMGSVAVCGVATWGVRGGIFLFFLHRNHWWWNSSGFPKLFPQNAGEECAHQTMQVPVSRRSSNVSVIPLRGFPKKTLDESWIPSGASLCIYSRKIISCHVVYSILWRHRLSFIFC